MTSEIAHENNSIRQTVKEQLGQRRDGGFEYNKSTAGTKTDLNQRNYLDQIMVGMANIRSKEAAAKRCKRYYVSKTTHVNSEDKARKVGVRTKDEYQI